TVIRTLNVVGESELEGRPVLVIDENERTFSKGEGSQGQHQINIETQGSTKGRLYFDRDSGQMLSLNSSNKTSISIKSSARFQHFSENSTEITQRVH
ncbi:MAG: hypothetical protein ACREGC_03760, partial [Minisyncoccia bacterium]